MKVLALTLSTTLLAACAPPPGPMPVEPYPPYTGGPAEPDQCGAVAHQWLVGRSHAQVPPPAPGQVRRVYGSGDALTRDLRPSRLNIEYDPRTHRIVRVWCG